MLIIDELITDRTEADYKRVEQLAAIGWDRMTEDERYEWFNGADELYADMEGYVLFDIDGYILVAQANPQKGGYDFTDMNRVGNAVLYLVDLLREKGYVVSVNVKNDWTQDDVTTYAQRKTYLDNVQALKDVVVVETELPADMETLTYKQANDIERVLVEVYNAVKLYGNAAWYSGEIISGEV